MKDALTLSRQFENTFKVNVIKNERNGFGEVDSMKLAVTELCVNMARSTVDSSNFHASQLAFRDRRIKELQDQIQRQVKMIEGLEKDVEFWRSKRK